MTEWGPEIKVDGVRPDWLGGDVPIFYKDRHGDWYGDYSEWFAHHIDDRDWSVFRLLVDHPYYSKPEASGADGSPYYEVTINGHTISCNDVIDALGLSFNHGELFKAAWRLGKKPGTSAKYDLDKIIYFANRELVKCQ